MAMKAMHPSICVHILPVSLWTLKTLLKQWMNDGSTGRYDSQIKSLSCVHFHTLESNHLKPRTNQLQLKKNPKSGPPSMRLSIKPIKKMWCCRCLRYLEPFR